MERKPNEIGPLEKRNLPHVGFLNTDGQVWFADADTIDGMIFQLQGVLKELREEQRYSEVLITLGKAGYLLSVRHPDDEEGE